MKTVLITGASSGIGKELAYVYAENNYDLILTARRKDRLEEIKKDIGKVHNVSVAVFQADLSECNSADKFYQNIKAENHRVDVSINNAGFGIKAGFREMDLHKEEAMLMLNMIALTRLTRLFGNEMIKNGGGHIINIASTAAFQPVPWMAAYAATKAYVVNFSEAIAHELKNDNVKVTAICPGGTQSEFAEVAGFDKEKNITTNGPTSRAVAEFTYRMMKKGKVSAIHGLQNSMLTFSLRFTPRGLATKVAAKIME